MSDLLSKEMQQQLVDRIANSSYSVMVDLAQAIFKEVESSLSSIPDSHEIVSAITDAISTSAPFESDILGAIEVGTRVAMEGRKDAKS